MNATLMRALAFCVDFAGINAMALAYQKQRTKSARIRIVNYHDVAETQQENFETQLRFYRDHFLPAGRSEIEALLRGKWTSNRPGLLLTFDDGMLSHSKLVAPLLEAYGFTGWFFAVAGLTDVVSGHCERFTPSDFPQLARGEQFMNWDGLRALIERGHTIGCHTMTHCRLGNEISPDRMRAEIVDAKTLMETRLGRPVDSFCWVGGEEHSYSRQADALVKDAGYRLGFMSNSLPLRAGDDLLHIKRANVEADWPMSRVRLALSGLVDLGSAPKRRRVSRMLRSTEPDDSSIKTASEENRQR